MALFMSFLPNYGSITFRLCQLKRLGLWPNKILSILNAPSRGFNMHTDKYNENSDVLHSVGLQMGGIQGYSWST